MEKEEIRRKFVLRRKRELERKSDNNNQIPVPAKTHFHSSILHSTTEHKKTTLVCSYSDHCVF